jgi:S-formylglutathione hydrolase
MTFNIYMPDDEIKNQRGKPYPVIYYLSGLTCNQDNAVQKSGFARFAKKHNVAMVFPDTSPRNLDVKEVNDNDDWMIGYGAGHYCNATNEPYSKNFNMFDYVSTELVDLVNEFFPVDPERKSIMGHSMGGNGALMVAANKRQNYRSASAFAPIGNTTASAFC